MNPKTLVLLLGATGVVAAGAALALKNRESSVTVAQDTGRFFPSLIDSLNDVTSVAIRTGAATVTLQRKGDAWTLAEKSGYAAEEEPIRKLLIGLAELHKVEPKTSDPERWAKLGVEDVDAEEAVSKEVTLKNGSGATLAALVVGHGRTSQDGRRIKELYVRAAGDDQAWLVQGEVDIKATDKDWLQKEIYSIPQSRIQSIEIEHADGEWLRVRKESEAATGFDVLDRPEDRELRFPTVANSMAGGVSSIKLDDVEPAGAIDFEDGWLSKTTVRAFDGLILHATLKDVDGKSYATFAARYEPPAGPPPPEDAEDAEDADADEGDEPVAQVEALDKRPEELQAEADALNARCSSWTYVIPQYNRTTLTKRMADMVKEPAPETDPLDDDAPMVIPDSLPPEIQQQIREHQESLGNKTVTRPVETVGSETDGDGD